MLASRPHAAVPRQGATLAGARLTAPSLRACPAVARLQLRVAANGEAGGAGKSDGGSMEPSGWDGKMEKQFFGENVGARDITRGEAETNFSDKVWFNWDTEHIIKPPDAMGKVLGLKSRKCQPAESLEVLDAHDTERLRNQVPGWRLVEAEGKKLIAQEFKVKSEEAGQELITRFKAVVEQQGHQPSSMKYENTMTVQVELFSTTAGGLTENDFIIAAKLNDVERSDLAPPKRQRFWA